MTQKKTIILTTLCLFLFSFFFYYETLFFEFIFFDEPKILLNQTHLFGSGSVVENLKAIFIDEFPREEPLLVRDLSWLIDSKIFGFKNAFGYHFSNLLYHSLTVSCAFLFFFLLTNKLLPSILTVVIFSLLAVNIEPIAWVMGRKDILAGLFLFMMLISELLFQRSQKHTSKTFWYVMTLLFISLACLSKISAAIYPIILWWLKISFPIYSKPYAFRMENTIRAFIQVLPHLMICFVIYTWYKGILTDFGLFEITPVFSYIDYIKILIIIDPIVILQYLKLLIYPESLSIMYQWHVDSTWFYWILGLTSLILIISIGLFLLIKRRDLLFYYVSFFILMLPYMNLVHFGWWYANRYLYASSFFLLALLIFVFWEIRKTPIGWLLAAFIFIIISINLYTNRLYLPIWKNGITFHTYEAMLKKNLHSQNALIDIYLSKSYRVPKQEKYYWAQKAIKLVNKTLLTYEHNISNKPLPPQLYNTYFFQGVAYGITEASLIKQLEAFTKAYAINPDHDQTNRALGAQYYKLALETDDKEMLKKNAQNALKYFNNYFLLRHKSYDTSKEKYNIYLTLYIKFPFLLEELIKVYPEITQFIQNNNLKIK
ncbi:MAG: hypothetical protein KZQ83_12010 [gamma proteobacterium symbiont of Taylorina sp.]|nr:hypothetical protein [gamma proteobacterium symbiont of Taylorina sp.]